MLNLETSLLALTTIISMRLEANSLTSLDHSFYASQTSKLNQMISMIFPRSKYPQVCFSTSRSSQQSEDKLWFSSGYRQRRGFPGSSAGKESTYNAGDPGFFNSWVQKIPWRRERLSTPVFLDVPGGSAAKESSCNAGDLGLIPGLGRSPEGGHGQPTPVFLPGEWRKDRGAWQPAVHGVTKTSTAQTRKGFSLFLSVPCCDPWL